MTYPRRWVDRTNEARVADLVAGTEALVLVTVRSAHRRTTRNRRTIVEAVVGDGTGRLHVVFFNQPWRERQLVEGLNVALFGTVDLYRNGLQMTNPIVDLIGDRTGRIVPIYPQSEKVQLSTWELAGWVENALDRCRPRGIADPLPDDIRTRLHARRARRRRCARSTSRRRSTPRTRPAGAWPSTSCCASSSCSSAASGRSRRTRSASSTRSAASSCGASTPPCRTS